MKSLFVEAAFFSGDVLIARGTFDVEEEKKQIQITSDSGDLFEITHKFEEPASPIEIKYVKNQDLKWKSALRMGVHDSDDWETINLVNDFDLCFKCEIKDKRIKATLTTGTSTAAKLDD